MAVWILWKGRIIALGQHFKSLGGHDRKSLPKSWAKAKNIGPIICHSPGLPPSGTENCR